MSEDYAGLLESARTIAWTGIVNTAKEHGWLPVTFRGAFQAAFQAANPYRALTEGTKE